MFIWTYSENRFEYLSYQDGSWSKSYSQNGNLFEYSSVVIGEDRIYFVYKGFAWIQVWNDMSPSYEFISIDRKNFVPADETMRGFYPRQVYLHPRNNEYFYIKFPQHVCLMTLIGSNQPKTIECNKVLSKMISDDKWNVVVGTYSYVVFSPEGIKEYMILGNEGTLLHSVDLPFTWPVHYNSFLNTAIFKTQDGQVVYYKLNKPLADCIYYSAPLGQSEANN